MSRQHWLRRCRSRLAGEDVQTLHGFAAGGDWAAVVPLDVEQASLFNDGEDLGGAAGGRAAR
jgi:hypothetical protein